jgi:predicted nucleotidyltransferase
MRTYLNLTPEQIATYRNTALQLQKKRHKENQARFHKAWELAREAAILLKESFGITKVVVFGSLLRPDCFTQWSDIDIAAWGIDPGKTFQAILIMLNFDSEIEINLVDVNTCRPDILASIEKEGVEV